MGQNTSYPARPEPIYPRRKPNPPPAHSRTDSADVDPFHRSPMSPWVFTTTPLRSSADPSNETTVQADPAWPTLPRSASTLGARVVRKLSRSARDRQPQAVVQPRLKSGGEEGKMNAGVEARLQKFERLVDALEAESKRVAGKASYKECGGQGLASSVGSSAVSGPSAVILTPPTSASNLTRDHAKQLPDHALVPPLGHSALLRRSTHLTRSLSASSARSGHAPSPSGRSRSRAEREWRARVAAISAAAKVSKAQAQASRPTRTITNSPRSPHTPIRQRSGMQHEVPAKGQGESPAYKGPLPPRRRTTPGAGGSMSTNKLSKEPLSGVSGVHALPPHLAISLFAPTTVGDSPGGRSFTSLRSFDTLGHHPTRACAQLRPGEMHRSLSVESPISVRLRGRQASVPRSVTSSLFEPMAKASRMEGIEETRPVSLAASTFLSPLRQTGDDDEEEQGVSLVSTRAGEEVVTRDCAVVPIPTTSAIHTQLQPITPDKHSAAVNVWRGKSASPSSGPVAFASGAPDRRRPSEHRACPSTPANRPDGNIPTPPAARGTTVSSTGLTPCGSSSDIPANSQATATVASPPLPLLLHPKFSTPTPTRLIAGETPSPTTPYSPMTAYILSAPSIDITFPMSDDLSEGYLHPQSYGHSGGSEDRPAVYAADPPKAAHPFATFLNAPSPPRPSHATRVNGQPLRLPPGYKRVPGVPDPICAADVDLPGLPPLLKPRVTPVLAPPRAAHSGAGSARPPSRNQVKSQPLRPRLANRTSTPGPRETILGPAEKQIRTRGRPNLCPGMDEGVRPPKRGMDVSDLEKWLAGTSMSD